MKQLGMVCAAALAVTLVVGMAVTSQAKPRPKKKVVVVGKDAPGDWNGGTGAEAGDAAGQDLVKATMGMRGRAEVVFTIGVTTLPENPQQTSVYNWGFSVDDGQWQLSTGCAESACTPGGVSFVLMECGTESYAVLELTSCSAIETIAAETDPGKATISIPVPLSSIGAKPGKVITARGEISAAPGSSLDVNGARTPSDFMAVTKSFKIRSHCGAAGRVG